MRRNTVYIQRLNGEIIWDHCFTAWQGFAWKSQDYEIKFFESHQLASLHITEDTPVIGSVEATIAIMKSNGIPVPKPLNIPNSLIKYAGRTIDNIDMGTFRSNFKPPIFIKPAGTYKEFTSGVLQSKFGMEFMLGNVADDTEVMTSSVVDFVSEYRVFVLRSRIVGMRQYMGDSFIFPNTDIIKQAVYDFTEAPCAYALDFGITSDGKTLLVEASDCWALGPYSINPLEYSLMCHARWKEIYRQKHIK